MTELSTIEQTERWMHKHPKTAIILIAGFLVAFGVFMGMLVTTNIYDSEYKQIFREAAATHRPYELDAHMYLIEELHYLNGTYQPIPLNQSVLRR